MTIKLSEVEIDDEYTPEPTAVLVDGPYPNANQASDWEEYPEWAVGVVDNDGEDCGEIYHFRSYKGAVELGLKIAHGRGLEFVNEASPRF